MIELQCWFMMLIGGGIGGVAINTCVIPLLPQSVNRAGGEGGNDRDVESVDGQVCTSRAYNRDILKPALNVCVSACFATTVYCNQLPPVGDIFVKV